MWSAQGKLEHAFGSLFLQPSSKQRSGGGSRCKFLGRNADSGSHRGGEVQLKTGSLFTQTLRCVLYMRRYGAIQQVHIHTHTGFYKIDRLFCTWQTRPSQFSPLPRPRLLPEGRLIQTHLRPRSSKSPTRVHSFQE